MKWGNNLKFYEYIYNEGLTKDQAKALMNEGAYIYFKMSNDSYLQTEGIVFLDEVDNYVIVSSMCKLDEANPIVIKDVIFPNALINSNCEFKEVSITTEVLELLKNNLDSFKGNY